MRHRKRLERLEQRWRPVDCSPKFLVVWPEDWPETDREAFDGGSVGRDALIERHTGQRPGPRTRLIVIRRRSDGPP